MTASEIAGKLLEADPDSVDPRRYAHQYAEIMDFEEGADDILEDARKLYKELKNEGYLEVLKKNLSKGSKDKNSRNGETFTCTSCGYRSDADINASVNILKRFRLPEDIEPVKLILDKS